MSQHRICPYSQIECRFECSETNEYCFQMRQDSYHQIRKGHEKFGKIAPFEEEPPHSRHQDQGEFNNNRVKPHALLHNKVYFQGIDNRQLNPNPEQNEEAQRNAEELQLRNALRHTNKNLPKPSPY